MYLYQEFLTTGHVGTSVMGQRTLSDGDVEAAVLRGRKMRSEAFWNLLRKLARPLARALAAYRKYRQTQAAVAALRLMNRHLLADIGLTPGDVERAVRYGREYAPKASATAYTPKTVAANEAGAPRQAA